METLRGFLRKRDGATMIEYALIAALLVLSMVGAVGALSVAVRSLYDLVINAPW